MTEAQEFWDQRYGEKDRIWTGRVNVRLAEVAAPLTPGRALDLGCGEGGDAMWLAERGWHVVAVDVSQTALQRAADDARTRGVSDRIDFQQMDLSDWTPPGTFDLVSAQFLHSPVELDRPGVLRRAAEAVATGGLLVIVDHAGPPPWESRLNHHHEFPSVDEVVDGLALDASQWERLRAEAVSREVATPGGETKVWDDNVIVLRRHASG